MLRTQTRPTRANHAIGADSSRHAEQLAELVGRVALKDLVRETTEITEKLCIEAALKLTGDNRAAAAQMLGLSRQSLYGKLRRYNIGDLSEPEDGEDSLD
jgi:DNA-binding NtrC family response regulator